MAKHSSDAVDPTGTADSTGTSGSRRGMDLGRAAALVPVAVLLACGVAVASTGVPTATPTPVAASTESASDQARVEVPDSAVREPASVAGPDGRVAPALEVVSSGSVVGSDAAAPVRLDTNGIPTRALTAYRHSERLLDAADPGCNLSWALVAAIGRVESNHGSFGGNRLGEDGVARPGIIGIQLDGTRNTARITDSDGGRWDGDATYDRAVGPMQFIPGTWQTVGADAEPDGDRNPQDIDDAAAATGVYLCSGPGDLTQSSDLYGAVRRYNNSDEYVRTVLAIADAYARGVRVLPASSLPAAGAGAAVAPAAVLAPTQPPAEPEPAAPAEPAGPADAPAAAAAGDDPSPAAPSPGDEPADDPVGDDVVGGLPPAPAAPAPSVPSAPDLPDPNCVQDGEAVYDEDFDDPTGLLPLVPAFDLPACPEDDGGIGLP